MNEVLAGRWCRPRNTRVDETDGLQDDRTARRLGYQPGTVAASVHLEQFVPLLLEQCGQTWWQRGSLAMCFESPSLEGEPVRCYLEPTGRQRLRVWMNGEGETLLMRGTAALGEDTDSAVRRRLGQVRPASEVRMLADVRVGRVASAIPVTIPAGRVDRRLAAITEPMECYRDPAAFGARVAPLANLVQAMRAVEPAIAPVEGPQASWAGALEVDYLDGPVLCDRAYLAEGRVLAVSDSPKTEILWYRTDLYDAGGERAVARMLMMHRSSKEASPLWTEAPQARSGSARG